MINKNLYYFQPSIMNSSIILQPELSQEATYFSADLVDPALTIDAFYRLHRVLKIRKGRTPLTEMRITSFDFDPFICVENDTVSFEVFSNDCTNYAKLIFNEEAFRNISEWKTGITNVDFTPNFIKQLRSSKGSDITTIKVDPEGFSVDTDKDNLFEKSVDMPYNWELALETMRNISNNLKNFESLKSPEEFIKLTPFNPFLQRFASIDQSWQTDQGWKFAELLLRNNLGSFIIGYTDSPLLRFDGRENPRYTAVRDFGMLRTLKSYILCVNKLSSTTWEVSGNNSKHIVTKERNNYTCDCKETMYTKELCKHIRAVTKPENKIISNIGDSWKFLTRSGSRITKDEVKLENGKFTCSCNEFERVNMCDHILTLLKNVNDFQFDELLNDLT